MKIPYVAPTCGLVVTDPHSRVLMVSNESYPIVPFDPEFNTSAKSSGSFLSILSRH